MALPVNVDSTYADSGTDASVALHQQHHDSLHARFNAGDYFKTGFYSAGMDCWGTLTTQTVGLGNVVLAPFLVPVRRAFDRMGVWVNSAGSSDSTLRFGIYNPGIGRPGSLLVDAGTVSSSTSGAKTVVVSQTLDPGLYWLALISAGTTAAGVFSTPTGGISRVIATATTPLQSSSFYNGLVEFGGSRTTMPTNLTATIAENPAPILMLRAA